VRLLEEEGRMVELENEDEGEKEGCREKKGGKKKNVRKIDN
jgi:hypothetical protein